MKNKEVDKSFVVLLLVGGVSFVGPFVQHVWGEIEEVLIVESP
jgi:hypothetical protein